MKLTRRESLLGLSAMAIAASASRLARADDLDDVLAKVARARASLKTLVGPFTQVRKIGLLASEVRSAGTLTLVRPDRLRWELAPPDEVTYWITPEGVAYKSKSGQGRVQGGAGAKLGAALDDLRVLLAGDLSQLRARYDMKLVANDASGVAFEATPKQKMPHMERLAFALLSDFVRPSRATIVETARDRTDIQFGALERDVKVDPARMRPPS